MNYSRAQKGYFLVKFYEGAKKPMIMLETDRLYLRDYAESDFKAYYQLKTDDHTMYYLKNKKLNSPAKVRSEFMELLADIESIHRKYYFLHMELKDTHEQVGSIGYTVIDDTPIGKIVDLGYLSYQKFWGKGYTTEALKRVLEFAFAENNVYRVTSGCLSDNIGSERVMQKSGMIKEAELIDYEWHDGKMKTRLKYRLLRNEWEHSC